MTKHIIFSPVTRLSGLLSVDVLLENGVVTEANTSATLFRGFEWIMRGRHITDAVYLTQRVCGICSLAHGAVSSYLVDAVYDNDISANAQYLRNIMFAADFLQNHIRHFYIFSLPDYVKMPDLPPFQKQNTADLRLNSADNCRISENYFKAAKASQRCHEIIALFGGKIPHQHSFLHGGVTVAPTADKINRALALLDSIKEFVHTCMLPDTEIIANAYQDYFTIGRTPKRLLSFGLFRFGAKNERVLWRSGVLQDSSLKPLQPKLIREEVTSTWLREEPGGELRPDPQKLGAYTWTKTVKYAGQFFEGGPLARMLITERYKGGTSTMDRIGARTLETSLIADLVEKWLYQLTPGPPPLNQNKTPVRTSVTSLTDAMRGALMHQVRISGEQIIEYNIITPTGWNFAPKDQSGKHGPAENALLGTQIPSSVPAETILGRIIRSFDPCLPCATHYIETRQRD
ncbi:MAG: nickel-dependent hydrogenase large subunit [Syntrophaceticus sp.]|nr:nickel-dependent hydrogenase large subunit [Syntrophaceticus sp.]MDD4360656.1 nickel-dependent hydrogenase large subunit [Syntrophaceticus sp.]MDD4783194.1 nickel-dependent hydrogenase large subunit [Syntrophaceticus sp.]